MRRVVLVAVALVALGACGGSSKVGEAFEEFEGGQGGERIGALDRTPTPPPPDGGQQQQPQQQEQAPPPQQTQAPVQGVDVKITNQGFDPTAIRVGQGATINVTNTDSQPHTYTVLSGDAVVWDTGSLGAGQSKSFVVDRTGQFQVEDRTRNWILGQLEVVAG